MLIFPPPASPTYVPAGLAALSAYVKINASEVPLVVMDMNIEAWHLLAKRQSEFERHVRYAQGQEGNFYDKKQYLDSLGAYAGLSAEMDSWWQSAKHYLESGKAESRFLSLLDALLEPAIAFQAELMGFSLLYPKQVVFGLALALRLREKLGDRRCRIVLGGAMMTALDTKELLAACPFVDDIVPGEGEEAFLALCQGRPTPANRPLPVENIPPPDFSFADLSQYFNPEPVLPVLFSRGCAWHRCRFCAHNFSYGHYRHKITAGFVEELKQLEEKQGARHFYFADQYLDEESLDRLADEILRQRLDIRFHAMGRPSKAYTRELLEKLHKAGCRWISWGVESGSQALLDKVDKGVDAGDLPRLIRDTHASGISNLLMLIFGLPGSTDADYEATVQLLEKTNDVVDAVTSSRFQLFDHTPFARHPEKWGLKVTGQEILFVRKGSSVHSFRLNHDGARADAELAQWEKFKLWTRGECLFERLGSEHYLLYADHQSR